MRQRIKLVWPLLVPLLVSGLPILIYFHWSNWQVESRNDQLKARWRNRLHGRADEFRAGFRLPTQLARMAQALEADVRGLPAHRFNAENLATAFRRLWPPSHRPTGTRLYGFTASAGVTLQPLTGPGLCDEKARYLARLLTDIIDRGTHGGESSASIDKRAVQMFGALRTAEVIWHERQGRPIRVVFGGEPGWLLWGQLIGGGRVAGAYAVVVPDRIDELTVLDFALRSTARGADENWWPVLIPIVSCADSMRPLVPAELRSQPEIHNVLRRVAAAGSGRGFAGLGELTEIEPGLHVFRTAVAAELPYELWLIRGHRLAEVDLDTMRTAGAVWGLLWAGIGLAIVVRGRPLRLGMRPWMLGFIALVGGVPLLGVLAMGTTMIEHARDRRVDEAVRDGAAILQEIDAGAQTRFAEFKELCRNHCADSAFKAAVLASAPHLGDPQITACFRRFAAAGLPLESLTLIPFGRPTLVISENTRVGESFAALSVLLSPVAYGTLSYLQAGRYPGLAGSLVARDRQFQDAYNAMIDREKRGQVWLATNRGTYFDLGDERLFQLGDVISRDLDLHSGIYFRARASAAFLQYTRDALDRVARRSPAYSFAMRTIAREGDAVTIASASQPTPAVIAAMGRGMAAAVWRQTDVESAPEGGVVAIAHPCRRMPGVVLAVAVDLTPILTQAGNESNILYASLLGVTLFLALIGLGLTRHFLEPLAAIERGIGAILTQDLDTRLDVRRDDELGDIAGAFDRMVVGFKERRELASFVSGALTVSIAAAGSVPAAPQSRHGVVLASDIRGFTTLSEEHPPERVVEMLNHHLEAMSGEIERCHGVIDRFIGDAIIAVFLDPDPGTAARAAIEAGRGMRRGHERIIAERAARGLFPYEIGVGIAAGPLMIGTFGSADRMEFTVIGHARTAAEEFEAQSKTGRHTRIVLAPALAALCPDVVVTRLCAHAGLEVVTC